MDTPTITDCEADCTSVLWQECSIFTTPRRIVMAKTLILCHFYVTISPFMSLFMSNQPVHGHSLCHNQPLCVVLCQDQPLCVTFVTYSNFFPCENRPGSSSAFDQQNITAAPPKGDQKAAFLREGNDECHGGPTLNPSPKMRERLQQHSPLPYGKSAANSRRLSYRRAAA